MTVRNSVLLDTVSAEVAVLHGSGTIVSVNGAWNRFGLDNGGEPGQAGVGVSYLDVRAAAEDQPSQAIAAAIRAALSGDLPTPETIEIVSPSQARPANFDVLISERTDEVGAVVTLSPVHRREASMHEELTQELLAVGAGLQRLLTLHEEPARAALDPTLVEDVREVVSRLWTALLGPTKSEPQDQPAISRPSASRQATRATPETTAAER